MVQEESHIKTNTYKVLPNMSLDVGLTWEMAWKVVHWSMTAGYEFQYWWRQNQRPHLDYGATYSWVRHAEDLASTALNSIRYWISSLLRIYIGVPCRMLSIAFSLFFLDGSHRKHPVFHQLFKGRRSAPSALRDHAGAVDRLVHHHSI